ncbi:MAG: YhbY family RNA-binding protein [Gammaproteobacteria bacterium]|nr:YhbY family RNA-binding protein [Gammaproteobacteria bacterium]TVQ43481.1 MAG: YhbY family RNA-binding protein [Gammaproteobacteria bacterium]
MTLLSDTQKKYLRSLGHDLKPVLMVGGNGITPALLREAEITLDSHELIKVRLRVGDRDARDTAIAAIVDATGATLVQRIGHVALLYRRHPEQPGIILPSG